jgi:hypothetical protein
MATKLLAHDQKLKLASHLVAVQTGCQTRATRGKTETMSLSKTALVAPLLCVLAACGTATASNNDTSTNAVAPVTTNGTAVSSVSDPSAFKVGTNLPTVQYWDGSRPFMNLILGGEWTMSTYTSGAQPIPAEDFDSHGWVKQLPAGYRAAKTLSIPAVSADMVCTYQGNGNLDVAGPVSNVVQTAGKTTFHYDTSYPGGVHWAWVAFNVDPTNYIRNIDCREAESTTTSSFAPEFTNTLAGFKVIRFMKWQTDAVEGNAGVSADAAFPTPTITWANRNLPGDADFTRKDGVPVELEVELANQVGADPFFSMPWNADDDYITKFATYVRDHLAPGHQVYVENSNEVWNWFYAVSHQALNEGKAEGLDGSYGGDIQINAERYAEKSAHVMDIWKSVFAATGQSSQLVRVASYQNVQPIYSDLMLKYNNAYTHFDALATAPYFGLPSGYTGQSVDDILNTILPQSITDTIGFAAQNKAVAQKYGLRYITYEAGQGVEIPNNVSVLTQIERDPRMYDLYTTYLNGWKSQIGDTITLLNLTGMLSMGSGWGMVEYAGEPVSLSATPKMQAVKQFLGTTTTTALSDPTATSGPTTTTITCPDGTVIDSTSTCPTTSTGSTSGSTSTSPGKRTGSTKGGGGKGGKTATV